jgi:hypothetical protein
MIANEIGIAVLPAAVRFTAILQTTAHAIRNVNEATSGWAGNLAFTGALALSGIGTIGLGLSALRNVVSGLQWAGIIGAGTSAAAGAAGTAGAAGAAGAGAAAAGAATTAGGGTAAAAGGLSGLALNPALLITGGLAVAGHSYVYETEMRRREAQGESRSTMARVADWLSWLSLPALGGRALAAITGGPDGAATPADVSERHPAAYGSALDLYRALSTQAQGTPGPLAEQEARAMTQWLETISGQLQAIQQQGAAGGTWSAPPAAENG